MDVVAFYLKGTAFIWFNTSGAREWKNSLNQGHSFKHLFEKQFCDPFKMSQWKHQLRNRKQRPGETIDEYTSAMEELWKRIDPRRRHTELDRISEYIEGLRAEFIVPVQSSMPQNVKEAINKAKAIETAFSIGMDLSAYSMLPGYLQSMNGGMVPARTNMAMYQPSYTAVQQEITEQLIEEGVAAAVSQIQQNNPSQKTDSQGRIICYLCNKTGHIARNCRQRSF